MSSPAQDLPVIFQLTDAPTWRGGEQQVLYLHQGLLAHGVDSRVVCRRGGALHRRLDDERLPHYALGLHGAHDLFNARRVGLLAAEEGGILHAHSSHSHDLALWASRLGGASHVVVSRRVDFPVGRGWWSRRKYRSRRVDLYLAISSAVRRELEEGGIEPERIHDVPSGIDLSRFEDVSSDWAWRQQLGLRPGELLFGNVAALAPHKDQETLLRGFAEFRARGGEGKLVILGEGSLRPRLQALRTELDLDDEVFLPGFLDPVLPAMKTFDIFVLSSYLEGLGTAILDAMALGLPVIATRTGGIVDAVADGRTGRLVPPRDPVSLAEAMHELQSSAELRRRLGEGGADRVTDFDVRVTVEKTLDAYRKVASLHA